MLRRVTFVKSEATCFAPHAFHQPKTHRLWLVFLGCHGKSHQKRPLKPMVSKSYVLRTRMHSTSQKSIACGSYFWGVMDPCTSGAVQTDTFSAARTTCFIFPWWKCSMGLSPLFAAAPLRNVGADASIFCKGKRTSEGGAEGHATFKGSFHTPIFARLDAAQIELYSAQRNP